MKFLGKFELFFLKIKNLNILPYKFNFFSIPKMLISSNYEYFFSILNKLNKLITCLRNKFKFPFFMYFIFECLFYFELVHKFYKKIKIVSVKLDYYFETLYI